MKTMNMLLIAMTLLCGGGAFGRSPDSKLDKTLQHFLYAYQTGDADKILRFYEKEAFLNRAAETVDRCGLLDALKAEFRYRGAPAAAEVGKVVVQGKRAFVRVHFQWKGGYQRNEMTFWVLQGKNWYATANRTHAYYPDADLWNHYDEFLRAAFDSTPPTPEELEQLLSLTRNILAQLNDKGCASIMEYVTPYRSIASSFGWDLQAQTMEFCNEVWFQSPQELTLGSPPDWSKARVKWSPFSVACEASPNRKDVAEGRGICCIEVFVPTPSEYRPDDGYLIKWVRTSDGWRIWEIGYFGMQT